MRKQKEISTLVGIVIIIAVVVIIFGGVFAYQYFLKSQIPNTKSQINFNVQNSNAETAGWKTYTNSQYGYSFKFPSVLGAPIYDNLSRISWSLPLAVSRDRSHKYFGVNVTDAQNGFCYFENIGFKGSDVAHGLLQKLVIGDNTYIVDTDFSEGGTETTGIIKSYDIRENNKCYAISLSLSGPGNNDTSVKEGFDLNAESKIVEDIISTSKFMK